MVEAVDGNLPTITYEKKKVKEQRLNFNNFANLDTKSFNSKIGGITNLASNMIAMLSLFDENSLEYKELKRRISLLRFYQGGAIDATKGDVFVPPPKSWSKRQRFIRIEDSMTKEEKIIAEEKNKKIAFENRICCNRKTYFFGYVYPKLMKEYNQYKARYKDSALFNFGKTLDALKDEKSKSDKVKYFLRSYYNYLPLFNSKCTMNILARYIDDIEFDNSWKRKNKPFNYKVLLSDEDFIPEEKMLKQVKNAMLNFYNSVNSYMNEKNSNIRFDIEEDDTKDEYKFILKKHEEYFIGICSNSKELADYVIYLSYTSLKHKPKSLIWDIFGEEVVSNLRKKATVVRYPIQNEEGEEYLGKRYILKEVSL